MHPVGSFRQAEKSCPRTEVPTILSRFRGRLSSDNSSCLQTSGWGFSDLSEVSAHASGSFAQENENNFRAKNALDIRYLHKIYRCCFQARVELDAE